MDNTHAIVEVFLSSELLLSIHVHVYGLN